MEESLTQIPNGWRERREAEGTFLTLQVTHEKFGHGLGHSDANIMTNYKSDPKHYIVL